MNRKKESSCYTPQLGCIRDQNPSINDIVNNEKYMVDLSMSKNENLKRDPAIADVARMEG